MLYSVQAAEAEYPPVTCPNTDSPNYRPNVAHMVRDGQLLLVDTNTGGTLAVLDNQVLGYWKGNFDWGKNCRYLFAVNVWHPADPYPRRFSSIYDTLSGQRIFHSPRELWGYEVHWSPSEQQFFFKSVTGLYLMSESLAAPVRLFEDHYYWHYTHYWEWDMARNQLLMNFWLNPGYLMAFDINSGATLAAIREPEGCTPNDVLYTKSADNRYLLVYTLRGNPACLTVYDRDAGTVIAQVNMEKATAWYGEQIALSPDAHYLVVGLRALRVWDLWTLPGAFEDRLPIHRHEGPTGLVQAMHFISPEVIETTSRDGVQDWNILTGEQVGTS